MNRDDVVLRMAAESGCGWAANGTEPMLLGEKQLKRFAALIAAAEREECAKVCEETTAAWTQHLYNSGCMDCAAAIRARGES